MNLVFEDIEQYLNLYNINDRLESGDTRICPSSWANRVINLRSFHFDVRQIAENKLHFYKDEFEVNIYHANSKPEGKYIIPVGTHEHVMHWAGIDGDLGSIFDLIPEHYLEDLRSKKAFIAFDSSLEGYHDHRVFDFFTKESNRLGFSNSQIIFISGNSAIEERLDEWTKKHPKATPIHAVGYAHFEFDMLINHDEFLLEGQSIPTWEDHFQFKKNNYDRIKSYNFLNRKPRNHRVVYFNKLFHSGLLPDGLVSFNDWGDEPIAMQDYWPDKQELDHSKEITPVRWDGKDNMVNAGEKINRLNQKSMLNSWVTLVSEARFQDDEGTVFLSEKTFKPIACSHPFIILGNKGSLKELRKMGYVTYNNLINEDYDELDNIDRMDAITEELRAIDDNPDKLQWFKWLKPRIEYNKNVLRFNALFNPPAGFHLLNNLCKTS